MNDKLNFILKAIEKYLQNIYHDELDKVILFGSQAKE